MDGLNVAPLLIGVLALLVGWVIGFVDSNNRTAGKIKQAEAKAEHAAKLAEDKVAQLEARPAAVPAPAPGGAAPALLRLITYEDKLLLDMDGVRIDTSALSPSQRKRLIELLTLLRPWLEGGPATSPTLFPKPQVAAAPPVRLAPRSPVVVHSASTPSLPEEKLVAPHSMVGQIDSILQARLAGTSLAGRGIRLQESPEGGVIVYVGVEKYPTIDEVTDPQVKAAIRSAIAEWEATFTPGI
jgi:hypothetical protein